MPHILFVMPDPIPACHKVHGTAGRIVVASEMTYRPVRAFAMFLSKGRVLYACHLHHQAVTLHMGAEKHNTPESEWEIKQVSADRVRDYVESLSGIGAGDDAGEGSEKDPKKPRF